MVIKLELCGEFAKPPFVNKVIKGTMMLSNEVGRLKSPLVLISKSAINSSMRFSPSPSRYLNVLFDSDQLES